MRDFTVTVNELSIRPRYNSYVPSEEVRDRPIILEHLAGFLCVGGSNRIL